MHSDVLLSVVIISRNIEKFIGRSIESVLNATEYIEKKEIILVDSASTDGTVEIGKKYPIRIIKILKSMPLSPSAGRYVGYLHTKGRNVFFHDGDSLLNIEWFKKALPFLESHKDVGGVVGIITQEPYNNRVCKNWIKANKNWQTGTVKDFESFILIKSDVMQEVGSFNPWLKSREEGELAARIFNAGFKIHRLPHSVAHHLGYERETTFTEMKRKISSTYALGRIFRYHFKNKSIKHAYFKGSKNMILLGTCYTFFIISFLIALSIGSYVPVFITLTLVLLGYFYIIAETRNIRSAIPHILSITLRWPFLILGFLSFPKKPSEYPRMITVIKS